MGNFVFIFNIYGCLGVYFILYYIDWFGDIVIVLDLNGIMGYQLGIIDVYLDVYGLVVGNYVMVWNGLNGLGVVVIINIIILVMIIFYQG